MRTTLDALSAPGAGNLAAGQATVGRVRAALEGSHALQFAGGRSITARHDGDTFRAVYAVRFKAAVYVLHAFQKKARRGNATPKQELDLVRRRLAIAERHYRDTHRGD